MEDNRVKVRIYGQDYIISGERDEETIREIAAFVDSSIREVSKYFSGNAQGSLAVLAAVNITDELFETREKIAALTAAREQAGEDAQHYLKMWASCSTRKKRPPLQPKNKGVRKNTASWKKNAANLKVPSSIFRWRTSA